MPEEVYLVRPLTHDDPSIRGTVRYPACFDAHEPRDDPGSSCAPARYPRREMAVLTPEQRMFFAGARTATLATAGRQGRPRLVPICFALRPDDDAGRPVVYSPLDEKPKRSADPRDLARVKDLLVLPEVTLLVDRWDEDWSKLAWLRCYGIGELLEPGPGEAAEHALAVGLLRAKYPQYAAHALEDLPVICIRIDRAVGWAADARNANTRA